ncbi:MAG: FAD-dependent oxidoreductase [Burkholderiales bacterium]
MALRRPATRWVLLVAAILAIAAFFALDLGRFLSLDYVKSQRDQLEAWRNARPLAAAAIAFVAYVAVAALSLPGAAVMTIAMGAIFGLAWGTVLASFASSIGATLSFLASRFLFRDWVQQRFGDRLAAIDAGVRREGGFYLFTLRLVTVIPFFVINVAMGVTPLRTWTFYWVSQVGMLAGTVVFVNAGTQLARIQSLSDILSPALIASFAAIGLLPLIARKGLDYARARRAYAQWPRPRRFDRNLVVIGAGSAGLVAAYIAAALRAKVTLVEQHRMGGDCLNTGCIPSKALIRSSRVLALIRRAREFGLEAAAPGVDFRAVMERVQRVIAKVEPHDSAARYASLGVDVIAGTARIVTPWEVEVATADGTVRRLTTRAIVVATGAQPTVPPIPGLESTGYFTSDTIWSLRELPPRLLVIGGGPIGCELAQAFARLGSRVTQVEMESRILAREDPEVSAIVSERFAAEGIDVRTGHRALRFEVVDGEKRLVAGHAGAEVAIPFDAVLVAVGRTANVTGFGLEELGVSVGRTVETNAFLQTNLPNVYAAGDVAGPWQFTHVAAHQAWYAAVNALFDPLKKFRADYSVIPWATFVEPEVARVGLNEQEARARGIAHEVTVYGIDDLDRAIADGEAHGFVRVLTVPGKDRILGVTIVGEHAADLIAEFVLAMKHGIGLDRVLGTIHVYPTMAEANKYVAGAWKRAHAPQRALRWVERFHAWRRR